VLHVLHKPQKQNTLWYDWFN